MGVTVLETAPLKGAPSGGSRAYVGRRFSGAIWATRRPAVPS